MSRLKPIFFTRFSILSLVCIVALAIGMGVAISSLLTRAVSQWEWQNTAALVQREVRMAGLETVFTEPGSRGDRERWGRAFSKMLTSLPEVVRAKVWNRDAEILWSDQADLIGRKFPDNDELRHALAGDVDVEVKQLTKAEQTYEKAAFGRLAEIYVPIVGRSGRVVGVVEVYKYPDRLFDTIRRGRTITWAISLTGAVMLYAVLLPLFSQVFRRDVEEETLRAHATRLEGEVEQRTQQLLQAQKMQAVGLLAGGIAHDFNNLLTVITGHGGVLQARLADGAPTRRSADIIVDTAERASQLTRQLLAFSRRQVLERRTIDLNDVVTELSSILRRLIGENITLVTAITPSSSLVNGDRAQLEQVVLNLVVNARDAMPRGGRLTLAMARLDPEAAAADGAAAGASGDYIVLSVTDTGVGMDAATQSRIFEPFFTTKEPGKGTGLGLSTVYGVVEQHGGHIAVRSAPGEGSTFKIYLPATSDAIKELETRTSIEDFRGTETILLAEDDPDVRALTTQVLRDRGYTVLPAADGEAALTMLSGARMPRVDLLLTDVVMPKLSGWELAERVTMLQPRTAVLYMTGYTEIPSKPHAQILRKPFSPFVLSRAVRETIESRNAVASGTTVPAIIRPE